MGLYTIIIYLHHILYFVTHIRLHGATRNLQKFHFVGTGCGNDHCRNLNSVDEQEKNIVLLLDIYVVSIRFMKYKIPVCIITDSYVCGYRVYLLSTICS